MLRPPPVSGSSVFKGRDWPCASKLRLAGWATQRPATLPVGGRGRQQITHAALLTERADGDQLYVINMHISMRMVGAGWDLSGDPAAVNSGRASRGRLAASCRFCCYILVCGGRGVGVCSGAVGISAAVYKEIFLLPSRHAAAYVHTHRLMYAAQGFSQTSECLTEGQLPNAGSVHAHLQLLPTCLTGWGGQVSLPLAAAR